MLAMSWLFSNTFSLWESFFFSFLIFFLMLCSSCIPWKSRKLEAGKTGMLVADYPIIYCSPVGPELPPSQLSLWYLAILWWLGELWIFDFPAYGSYLTNRFHWKTCHFVELFRNQKDCLNFKQGPFVSGGDCLVKFSSSQRVNQGTGAES